ncbi:MAG: type II secretion system protein [Phycisphaerae bacterium]
MRRTKRRSMERQGFTLVELLIVITLIGLLAGLLFPVLTAAFDAGNNITCQNNLKEIASAVLAHASQHHGRIPPAVVLEPGDDTVGVWWCNLLVQRGYISAENTVGLDGRTEEPTVLLCPAGIDKRVTWATNPESPADDDAQGWARLGNDSPTGKRRRTADCSYYWNGSHWDEDAYRAFPSLMIRAGEENPKGFTHNLSEIRRRTRLVMVADGVWTNAISAGSRGRIAARHPGSYGRRCRTNIVFYDGHVEQYEWDEDYEEDPLWETEDLRAFAKDVENQSITLVFRLDDQDFEPEEEED